MKGLKETPNKTLSIRISTDGFCFCIYATGTPDDIRYHYREADSSQPLVVNLDNAWKECPFANETYSNIRVIIATETFTTIPSEYNNKKENEALYRICFPAIPEKDIILSNKLTAHGITILFSIDEQLYTYLCKLSDIEFYTTASILLGFTARTAHDEERYMLACYQKGKSTLLSIDKGRLRTSNSFTSTEVHDQIFYLLSIWKEQGLSQTDDTLYICGDKSVEELLPMLKQFIHNCKRINPNELFRPTLLNRIKDIPFDLQALILCE